MPASGRAAPPSERDAQRRGRLLTERQLPSGRRDVPGPPDDDVGGRRPHGAVARCSARPGLDEAARLAAGTEYGLSLAILTRNIGTGMELAERIPSGLVHINDQTINDEAVAPFGGVGDSGTGSRLGGARANLDAFTETQWLTVRNRQPSYQF